jgi:hypothetical protein
MSAFSHSPPPVDPSEFYGDHGRDGNELLHSPNAVHTQESPSLSVLTRTVAIIKTQALHQRLEIEPRILEANFEVSSLYTLFRGFRAAYDRRLWDTERTRVWQPHLHTCLRIRHGRRRRLTDISSQIVKERQMEFDPESDPETFYELFGDDARFLGE